MLQLDSQRSWSRTISTDSVFEVLLAWLLFLAASFLRLSRLLGTDRPEFALNEVKISDQILQGPKSA